MKKKLLSVLVAVIMLFGCAAMFAGCGDNGPTGGGLAELSQFETEIKDYAAAFNAVGPGPVRPVSFTPSNSGWAAGLSRFNFELDWDMITPNMPEGVNEFYKVDGNILYSMRYHLGLIEGITERYTTYTSGSVGNFIERDVENGVGVGAWRQGGTVDDNGVVELSAILMGFFSGNYVRNPQGDKNVYVAPPFTFFDGAVEVHSSVMTVSRNAQGRDVLVIVTSYNEFTATGTIILGGQSLGKPTVQP